MKDNGYDNLVQRFPELTIRDDATDDPNKVAFALAIFRHGKVERRGRLLIFTAKNGFEYGVGRLKDGTLKAGIRMNGKIYDYSVEIMEIVVRLYNRQEVRVKGHPYDLHALFDAYALASRLRFGQPIYAGKFYADKEEAA